MKIVPDVDSNLRVVLIGGTSHVGKSTLSESLAARLGWERVSTDTLARHPGRPWKPVPEKVPDHVAEHYLSLSVNELLEDVLHHYRVTVWPKVEAIVASHTDDASEAGVVLEGSALWPEFVTGLDFDGIAALWLTASDDVLRQRIHAGSMYRSKSSRERKLVDKFLERTLAYNSLMVDVVNRRGFVLVDVSQSSAAVWSLLWIGCGGLPAAHYEEGRRAQGVRPAYVALRLDDAFQHQPRARNGVEIGAERTVVSADPTSDASPNPGG